MKSVRSAVVGVGGIGKWHATMQKDTGLFKVVAVCDTNPALQEWATTEFPKARFYTDYGKMLKTEKLGLVSIVTPHNLHAPLAIKALNAGANVVVEKPMATTYDDAAAMVTAAKRNKRFVSVFHNRRLDPWYLAAKAAIDEGLLGDVIEINTGINYGPSAATWRGFKEPSGGLQFDWGAHLVDYCLNLHPGEIRAVAGYLYRRPDKPADQVEDHAVVHIYFADGTLANITSAGLGRVQPERYRIIGTKGTLIDSWDWGEGKVKVHTNLPQGRPVVAEIPYPKSNPQQYYNNIAAHVRDGKDLLVTGESAARVINVLCTAERSAAAGGVPMPLA